MNIHRQLVLTVAVGLGLGTIGAIIAESASARRAKAEESINLAPTEEKIKLIEAGRAFVRVKAPNGGSAPFDSSMGKKILKKDGISPQQPDAATLCVRKGLCTLELP